MGDYFHMSRGVNQRHKKIHALIGRSKKKSVKNQMYDKHILFINQIASCVCM